MKTYKLAKSVLALNYSILGFMTAGGFLLANSSMVEAYSVYEKAFVVVWMLFLVGAWYSYLRVPFELSWQGDNSIEFRSLLKKQKILLHEIESVKDQPFSYFVTVKHKRGKIQLVNHIDGFYEFLYNLKSRNPRIEIKGL